MFGILIFSAMPIEGQVSAPAPTAFEEETEQDDQDTVTPTKSDTALEEEIKQRFSESKIAANNFRVRVHDGTAYLDGTTDVMQHKGTATRLARLAGAEHTVNRIEISELAKQRSRRKRRGDPRRVHVRRPHQPRSEPRDQSDGRQ